MPFEVGNPFVVPVWVFGPMASGHQVSKTHPNLALAARFSLSAQRGEGLGQFSLLHWLPSN
jgi:hypothetical protein